MNNAHLLSPFSPWDAGVGNHALEAPSKRHFFRSRADDLMAIMARLAEQLPSSPTTTKAPPPAHEERLSFATPAVPRAGGVTSELQARAAQLEGTVRDINAERDELLASVGCLEVEKAGLEGRTAWLEAELAHQARMGGRSSSTVTPSTGRSVVTRAPASTARGTADTGRAPRWSESLRQQRHHNQPPFKVAYTVAARRVAMPCSPQQVTNSTGAEGSTAQTRCGMYGKRWCDRVGGAGVGGAAAKSRER